jgi:hypothetical protein
LLMGGGGAWADIGAVGGSPNTSVKKKDDPRQLAQAATTSTDPTIQDLREETEAERAHRST